MGTSRFQENRISVDDCEIVLAHKTHPPDRRLSLVVVAVVALLCFGGGLETTGDFALAIAIGIATFVLGSLGFPLVFYLKTNQLAVPTGLLADITYVSGYVQWPPIWPNSFFETRIRFRWTDVSQAQIRPVPWVYATENVQLELTLRDGRTRILRLPRLTADEQDDLAAALAAIATRQGFDFSWAPPIGPVRT